MRPNSTLYLLIALGFLLAVAVRKEAELTPGTATGLLALPASCPGPLLPRTGLNPPASIAFPSALSSDSYNQAVLPRVPSGLAVGGSVR